MSPESTTLCSHYNNNIPKILTKKTNKNAHIFLFPIFFKNILLLFLLPFAFPFFHFCFVFDNSARQLSHSIINLTFYMLLPLSTTYIKYESSVVFSTNRQPILSCIFVCINFPHAIARYVC